MERTCDEFLAGATRTANQDGGIGRSDLLDELHHPPHSGAGPDQREAGRLETEPLGPQPQSYVLHSQSANLHGSIEDRQHRLDLERLENIVERAEFHRFDGCLYRALSRHNDADELRVDHQGFAE